MYGQNSGVRPDASVQLIFTRFCVRVQVPHMFLRFEFQKDRKKNVGAVGIEISLLPLKRHIADTTACCYRTSRETTSRETPYKGANVTHYGRRNKTLLPVRDINPKACTLS